MTQSIRPDGPNALTNNTFVGEAYSHQLLHQPSLTDLAQQRISELARDMKDNHERIDEDLERSSSSSHSEMEDVTFDAMADYTFDDDSRDDSDLPQKYLNKMKRYKEMRNKVPQDIKTPDKFLYKDTMSSQATAYAELLKICQKYMVLERVCLMM